MCDVKSAPIYFPLFPTDTDVKKYGKLYRAFVRPNEKFKLYFMKEYELLLKGKRTIGVLCRGTDYIVTAPKGHPIQPKIEDVIILVKKKIIELNCDQVYLATEEEKIYRQFESEFHGKVIINKRSYFDEYYNMHRENPGMLISAVHFNRENDSYYKSLEYFSSIFLLSKCNALIAGSCGGSRAALYLNFGKYEYKYLFNVGIY